MRLCSDCGDEEALPRKTRGPECWLARQPVTVRVPAAEYRLALVPPSARRTRVPEKHWPPGRRFCAGCQSFVRLIDCPKDGSRCKTCAGMASHASMLASTYGVDKDTYSKLMNLQGGRCAICRRKPAKMRLVMDHDHKTGTARGLLCTRCNHELLGAAHDDVGVLRAAVYYLEHPPLLGQWEQPEVRRGEPAPAPF